MDQWVLFNTGTSELILRTAKRGFIYLTFMTFMIAFHPMSRVSVCVRV